MKTRFLVGGHPAIPVSALLRHELSVWPGEGAAILFCVLLGEIKGRHTEWEVKKKIGEHTWQMSNPSQWRGGFPERGGLMVSHSFEKTEKANGGRWMVGVGEKRGG
jgi:hypothetical protein